MKVGVVSQCSSPFLGDKPQLLATGLVERGHTVHFITTRSLGIREQAYVRKDQRYNALGPFHVRFVPYLFVMKENVVCYPLGKWVDSDYDGLVLFEDYPLISKVASLWALGRGIPVMISSERYYYPADKVTALALRTLDHTFHPLMWRISRALLCHSHAAISFFSSLGAPHDKARYMPGWIDAKTVRSISEQASRDSPRKDDDRHEIISVGRLHYHKGFDTLISSAYLLHRKNRNFRIRIIGRGPLERDLRDRVRALGLEKKVRIETTPVPNAEIPRLLSSADIYVQPSYVEPFGAAVVEAMASGLPVVSSAVGGLRDTVLAGETGMLVPPCDAEKLGEALDLLMSDPLRAKEMGKKGQERALASFDYRIIAEMYERLLSQFSM